MFAATQHLRSRCAKSNGLKRMETAEMDAHALTAVSPLTPGYIKTQKKKKKKIADRYNEWLASGTPHIAAIDCEPTVD